MYNGIEKKLGAGLIGFKERLQTSKGPVYGFDFLQKHFNHTTLCWK